MPKIDTLAMRDASITFARKLCDEAYEFDCTLGGKCAGDNDFQCSGCALFVGKKCITSALQARINELSRYDG